MIALLDWCVVFVFVGGTSGTFHSLDIGSRVPVWIVELLLSMMLMFSAVSRI